MEPTDSNSEIVVRLRTTRAARRAFGHLLRYGTLPSRLRASIRGALLDVLVDSPLRALFAGSSLAEQRVMFQGPDAPQDRVESLAWSLRDADDAKRKDFCGYHVLRFKSSDAARRALARLRSDSLVEFAHTPKLRVPEEAADPLANRQWALAATGLHHARAAAARWREPKDRNLAIAVIDTGVAGPDGNRHPDLEDVVRSTNFTGGAPFDQSGHGTHVIGVIGALTNNNLGISGYCSPTKIISIKALSPAFDRASFRPTAYLEALEHAVSVAVNPSREFLRDFGRVKVINLSLSGDESDETETHLIRTAIQNNVAVVAAMGNQNSDQPRYPAAIPGVIAVGATTITDGIWHEREGIGSNRGTHIDLVAPGAEILSTVPTYATHDHSDPTGFMALSGTSFAAAHVSAAVALLFARQPLASVEEIRKALQRGARKIAGQTGFSEQFGHGLLNIQSALDFF
jgi:subtilisin family serine protease